MPSLKNVDAELHEELKKLSELMILGTEDCKVAMVINRKLLFKFMYLTKLMGYDDDEGPALLIELFVDAYEKKFGKIPDDSPREVLGSMEITKYRQERAAGRKLKIVNDKKE